MLMRKRQKQQAVQLSIDGAADTSVLNEETEVFDAQIENALKKGSVLYPLNSCKYSAEKAGNVIKIKLKSRQLKFKEGITFAKPMSEEEQKQKLADTEQSVSKKSSKKSKLKNLFFFFLNLAILAAVLTYQLTKEPIKPLPSIRFDWVSFFSMLLLFGGVLLFETINMSYLMKISTNKWKFGTSFKLTYIGRYYDNITPMATGGQPFQIAYLKSHGEPMHTSLSIPLGKYVFQQIAWLILSTFCMIYSFTVMNMNAFVMTTSIIGFVLGSVVLCATIFLCVCKTVGKKLVVKSLKLLYKMKIVKNYDKQYEKITKYISDFQDVMQQYAKNPKDFVVLTLTSLIRMIIYYSIPFFIISFFNGGIEGDMFMNIFVMCNLVDMASSFFPLPGGTGMNELSFQSAFATIVGQGDILVWVLLGWRFFSYYVYLLMGIIILSYDVSYGNRKYRWSVARANLIEESNQFKQIQIDRFRLERSKRRKKM